ncbi:unnamed protein product [Rotaria sordida]|uniref:Uncharacterized protein n=1 Tax=Rotaria sordida TaxID=392033 RepID=A0A815Z9X0_9BILA|nr:unnamed protein product [Rotaria sordida]CAF1580060.1 unnamed protein product [Rotaria sordida]
MKQTTSSPASIATTSNITYNNNDDNRDIQFKKQTTINDVVAIKSNEYYFKLAKVNEMKDKNIIVTLFHYNPGPALR